MSTIQAVPALETQLEEGLHTATVVKVTLKTRFGTAGAYTALNLTFADADGATASAMLPHFRGKIATAFTALGDPLSALEEIAPERLMALRGRRAEVNIIHRVSKGKTYANVSSINGQVIA
jgi:hypothetical protein